MTQSLSSKLISAQALRGAGYDRVCPDRELPHRVQRWTGSEWLNA